MKIFTLLFLICGVSFPYSAMAAKPVANTCSQALTIAKNSLAAKSCGPFTVNGPTTIGATCKDFSGNYPQFSSVNCADVVKTGKLCNCDAILVVPGVGHCMWSNICES